MMRPFNIDKLRAIISAQSRDPRAPVSERQTHTVGLPPITNHDEFQDRWVEAQDWCREQVDHANGHVWSRRKDPATEHLEYSFSHDLTAVAFKLRFR